MNYVRVAYALVIFIEVAVILDMPKITEPPHRTITISYVVDVPDEALITDRYFDEAMRVARLIRTGTTERIYMTLSPRGHYWNREPIDVGGIGPFTQDGQWSTFHTAEMKLR